MCTHTLSHVYAHARLNMHIHTRTQTGSNTNREYRHRTHKNTHTLSLPLSPSLVRSLFFFPRSLTLSCSLSRALSLSHTNAHTQSIYSSHGSKESRAAIQIPTLNTGNKYPIPHKIHLPTPPTLYIFIYIYI